MCVCVGSIDLEMESDFFESVWIVAVVVGYGGSGAEDRRVWSFGLIYGFDFDFNFVNLWVSGFGWP